MRWARVRIRDCARDHAHRAAGKPRAAARRAIDVHRGQLQLAAALRPADAGGHDRDGAPPPADHRHAVHARRRHGADHDRRRPGAAERRGAGRHRARSSASSRARPVHVRRLHLERRHEDAARRPSAPRNTPRRRWPAASSRGATACPTAPRTPPPRTRRTRRRPTNPRCRSGPACMAHCQPRQARRSAGSRAGLCTSYEKVILDAEMLQLMRLVPATRWRPTRMRSASTRCARSGPGGHFFRRRTRWRATSTRSTRRSCRTGATSRPGATTGAIDATRAREPDLEGAARRLRAAADGPGDRRGDRRLRRQAQGAGRRAGGLTALSRTAAAWRPGLRDLWREGTKVSDTVANLASLLLLGVFPRHAARDRCRPRHRDRHDRQPAALAARLGADRRRLGARPHDHDPGGRQRDHPVRRRDSGARGPRDGVRRRRHAGPARPADAHRPWPGAPRGRRVSAGGGVSARPWPRPRWLSRPHDHAHAHGDYVHQPCARSRRRRPRPSATTRRRSPGSIAGWAA